MSKFSALKQELDSAFSTKVFYLFLFPFFFILFNLREIDYYVSWKELPLPVIIISASAFLTFIVLRLVFRSSVKAGIITFLLLGFILFYSDIYFLINTPVEIIIQNRYILLIFFLVLLLIGIVLHRSGKNFHRLNHYFNTLVLILCLFEAGMYLRYSFRANKWTCYISSEDKLHHPLLSKTQILQGAGRPDIYLVIVDSYTSAGSLKKYLHYDNSAFIDSLRALGFYTPSHATSNYAYTPLSLASLLNEDYLPDFNSKIENPVMQDLVGMSMINNSSVVRKLNSYGYESKNLSLFRLNGEEKFYTYDFLALPDYTLFSNKLFCKTVFFWYYIHGRIVYPPSVINDLVDSTVAVSRQKRNYPAFVYTHFSIPHGPFYFDKDGALLENEPVDHKIAYVEQLQYTNKVVLGMVKKIQDNSKKKSIILVLGDHGSRFFSKDPATALEDYSTLSSFYFPKEEYSALYDSISHVNIFRTVFNEYFNEKLPRLEDKQEFWKQRNCN